MKYGEFMNKFKEVMEFDVITCNKNFKNSNNKYKYLEENIFNELIDFIYEFDVSKENTVNSDILNFMKIGYKRNIGRVISIKNYVGLIELKSGFKLQILPKISLSEEVNDNKNTKTKKVFMEMIKSMKNFPCKVFTTANLNIDKMNLYEIFINMYIQEVRRLIKKGMKSSYISKEENIPFFKGKLQINKHIINNICHQEKFFVKFDEYHINRPENRIIKSTLLKLQKESNSAENVKEIKQILTAFELIDISTNYKKDFSKCKIDRSTKDYETLIKWSEVFLLDKSFTTFAGDNYSRALLFPMEKVFECYIAKYVKRIFTNFTVSSQDRRYYLFNEPRKQFALKPDLVLKREDGSIVIMDTKWKFLYNNERRNYGISEKDMYQMYVYAKKYKATEIYMIYPINEEMKEHKKIKFISNENNQDLYINVFFIDLERIEESMIELLRMCEKI